MSDEQNVINTSNYEIYKILQENKKLTRGQLKHCVVQKEEEKPPASKNTKPVQKTSQKLKKQATKKKQNQINHESASQKEQPEEQNKQCCLVCKVVWADNEKEYSKEYIQCDTIGCEMWVHRDCDKVFQKEPTLFKIYCKENLPYRCPNCRDQIRINIVDDIIRILSYFDVDKNFWMVDTNNLKYMELISHPMDFVALYKRNSEKAYQSENGYLTLLQDVKLILDNCLQYNLPNTKAHRKALELKAIFQIIFPHFKPYFRITEETLVKYSWKNQGFIQTLESMMKDLGIDYLDEAFRGNNQVVKLIGQPWTAVWEKQILAFSSSLSITQAPDDEKDLTQFEYAQNQSFCFEDKKEPPIKFSFREFSKHLLNQEITVKVKNIQDIIGRSKVPIHPYLQYLMQDTQQQTTKQELTQNVQEVSFDEELNQSNVPVNSIQTQQLYGFETEIQTSFNKLLNKDTSKLKIPLNPPMKTSILLSTDLICISCGTYENPENLFQCAGCGDFHHFYFTDASFCGVAESSQKYCVNYKQEQWHCLRCVRCFICQKANAKPTDLFCQLCNRFCHFKCYFQQYQPSSETFHFWKCFDCFKCEKCGSRHLIDQAKFAQHQQELALLSQGSPDNNSIPIAYFHGFTCCLFCGIIQSLNRFCDICEVMIPVDAMSEQVIPHLRQYLGQWYQSIKKNQDQILTQYYEDTAESFSCNYQLTQSKADFQSCLRCKRLFHTACLESDDIEINAQYYSFYMKRGFCSLCQLNQSEIIFRYEKCKQEEKKLIYLERKLTQIQPYLFVLFQQLDQQVKKKNKQLMPQSTFNWNNLSEEQKAVIIENIDQFHQLIQQFIQSNKALTDIKTQMFQLADISDDQMDKLMYYWSLRFGNIEYMQSYARQNSYDYLIRYEDQESYFAKYFESIFMQSGLYQFTWNISMIKNIQHTLSSIFKFGYFRIVKRTTLLLSDLQCNFVCNLIMEPEYQYLEDDFYLNQQLLYLTSPSVMINDLDLTDCYKRLREKVKINKFEGQRYLNMFVEPNHYVSSAYQFRQFSTIINNLKTRYSDTQINECFKNIAYQTNLYHNSIRGLGELYVQSMNDLMNKKHNQSQIQETPEAKKTKTPDQTQKHLERINSILQLVNKQNQPDSFLQSPLNTIQCQFCQETGHRKVSGRLIYCDGDRWVHQNCAIWSDEVKENHSDNTIVGVFQVFKNLKRTNLKCDICEKSGGTITCLSPNCRKRFHFYCAYKTQAVFLQSKKIICNSCLVDVQVYCVDQIGNPTERSKNGIQKNLLNEVINSQVMDCFTVWRKLVIVNQTKVDRQSQYLDCLVRFGNTTLLEVTQTQSHNSLFKGLKLQQTNFEDQIYHIFISINLVNNEYMYQLGKLTKQQLVELLNLQMNDKSTDNQGYFQPHTLSDVDKYIKVIFDIFEPLPLKSTQQLIQILKEAHVIPDEDIMNSEDQLGYTLLLFTQNLRLRLQQKPVNGEIQIKTKQDIPTSYTQWFLMDELVEDLPIQTRLQQLQWIHKVVPMTEVNKSIKARHPAFLKLKVSQNNNDQKLTPIKQTSTLSHKQNEKNVLVDKFQVKGDVLPIDIIQDAEIETENVSYQSFETDKQKELERKLKAEYQLIEQKKKKRISLYVGPSRIHKYGLFAKQKIPSQELVIEYTGEVISNSVADQREQYYIQKGFGDCYMFRASKDKVIDATFHGSQARYLNHSCDPNCASIVLEYNGQPKILIYAKREIQYNEELTYDYQFEVDKEKISCFCGAKNCLGRLN